MPSGMPGVRHGMKTMQGVAPCIVLLFGDLYWGNYVNQEYDRVRPGRIHGLWEKLDGGTALCQ